MVVPGLFCHRPQLDGPELDDAVTVRSAETGTADAVAPPITVAPAQTSAAAITATIFRTGFLGAVMVRLLGSLAVIFDQARDARVQILPGSSGHNPDPIAPPVINWSGSCPRTYRRLVASESSALLDERMTIAAVLVNHNTSAFAELAIRSLFVRHPGLDLTLTVYDNDSTDDRAGMLAAAERYGVRVVRSGFSTTLPGNSHGDVLRRFTLDPANRQVDHLLFLDADACFTRTGTIQVLLEALARCPDAFGAGPRMSWDGEAPLPPEIAANPALYRNRLHPCCALVDNTPLFRTVADQVG